MSCRTISDGFRGMTALGDRDAVSKIIEDVRFKGGQGVCSPPSCQGTVRPAILVTASIAGLNDGSS